MNFVKTADVERVWYHIDGCADKNEAPNVTLYYDFKLDG
jgi:hypothetical protein